MRLLYIIMGLACLSVSGVLLTIAFLARSAPAPFVFTFLSLSAMCFCLAYLYPQFKTNDERVKQIRQKGMSYSYFALLFYCFALMTVVQFELFPLTAMDVLTILSSLTIATVFLSWVILSHRL